MTTTTTPPPTTVGLTPIRLARLRLGTTAGQLRAAGTLGDFTRPDYPDNWVLVNVGMCATDRRHLVGPITAVRLEFCGPSGRAREYLEVSVETSPVEDDSRGFGGDDPYRLGLALLFRVDPGEITVEERREYKENVWATVNAVRALGAKLEASDRAGGNPSDAELWELADGVLDVVLDLLGDLPTGLDELLGKDGVELRDRYEAALVARRRHEAAHPTVPTVPTTVKERADALRAQLAEAAALKERTLGELASLQASCRDENKEKLAGATDCSGDEKWSCLDCGKVWWG